MILEMRRALLIKRRLKNAVEQGDFVVSTETLIRIGEEPIYEPHVGLGGHAHTLKVVDFFYFESGAQWRIPSIFPHYVWSNLYELSKKGLVNLSCEGDTFYYIALRENSEIAYVYNTKLFDWKDE